MAGLESRPRLLAVDDDHTILRLIHGILSQAGYDLDRAESAEAAQKLLDKGSYALLITDLNMPGATGLDLVRELRARKVGLPVILLSGAIDDETRKCAEVLGQVECMNKPLDHPALLDAVKRLVPADRPT